MRPLLCAVLLLSSWPASAARKRPALPALPKPAAAAATPPPAVKVAAAAAPVVQQLAAVEAAPPATAAGAAEAGRALEAAMIGEASSAVRPVEPAALSIGKEFVALFRGDPQIRPFVKKHRVAFWTSTGLLLGNAATGVAMAHYMGKFTDLAIAGAKVDGAMAAMILASGIILTAKATDIALNWTYLVVQRGTAQMIRDVRTHLVEHLSRLSMGFFRSNNVQELAPRIVDDVNRLTTRNWDIPIGMPYYVFRGALSFGMLAAIDWRVALGALPTLWAFNKVAVYFGRKLEAIAEKRTELRARTVGQVAEAFSMMEVHKTFGSEGAAAKIIGRTIDALAETNKRELRVRADNTAANGVVSFVINESLMFIGAWLLFLSGWPSLGTLMAMTAYAGGVQYGITSFAHNRTASREAAGATRRVLELLAAEPEIKDGPTTIGAIEGRVRFENVSFSYDGQPVLSGIDFEVAPGQTVAFVGATGSGKTTILRLLARLYDPTSGRILVDGHDLRDLKRASLTSQLAIVPQEASLFSGTIRENLLAVSPSATESQLRAALAAANAQFAMDKLDEDVGERGARLSGGQRQRVAIARAMLRDPRMLLLDEATSALDNESELKVQTALKALMQGRTTLLVAHRLTTVQDADLIFVLEGGRVAESGTHAELLAKKGAYWRLWNVKPGAYNEAMGPNKPNPIPDPKKPEPTPPQPIGR